MRLGLFADVHDHLDHLRAAVALFNERACEAVLFAGDLVSTFAVPPLRKLSCPLIACHGDNEGNKVGLRSGISLVGTIAEPPVFWESDDGLRIALVHMERQLRGVAEPFDVAVCGHTHKPRVARDDTGCLWINPGETGGWTFGRPTVVLFDTSSSVVELWELPLSPSAPARPAQRFTAGALRGSSDRATLPG
jgi:hypothetical protein